MQSFTIDEFCKRHRISRAQFYILQHRGEAPSTFLVGKRPRISEDQERAWITARQAASNGVAA